MNPNGKKAYWNYYTLHFLKNAIDLILFYVEKKNNVEKYLTLISDLEDLKEEIGKELDGNT